MVPIVPAPIMNVATVVAQTVVGGASWEVPGWAQWILGPLGVLFMFIFIAIQGAKEKPGWVFGREYEKMENKYKEDIAKSEKEVERLNNINEKTSALAFRLLEERVSGRGERQ